MPITAADIQFRLSGGAANTDPNASLGGAKSNTQVAAGLQNVFDNVGAQEAVDGDVEYRCIFVHNAHATLTLQSTVVWIDGLTSAADTEIDIGVDPAAAGADAAVIANESTPPVGVTFTRPTTVGAGLALGDLAPEQGRAVWIRRTVNAGAAVNALDAGSLGVRGETAP